MRPHLLPLLLSVACSQPRPMPVDPTDPIPSGSTLPDPTSTTTTTTTTTTTATTTTPSTTTTTPIPPSGCYTLLDGLPNTMALALLPPGGGPPQTVLNLTALPYYLTVDLEWFDGAWWACDNFDVYRIDPVTGQVAQTAVGCNTIVEHGGEMWVRPYLGSDDIDVYSSAVDLQAAIPNSTFTLEFFGTRTGSDGSLLYAAWHSTSELEVVDPATGAVSILPLQNYDTWVRGIEIYNGTLRVLDDGRQDSGNTRVVHFDPATGNELQIDIHATMFDPWAIYGLWCGP